MRFIQLFYFPKSFRKLEANDYAFHVQIILQNFDYFFVSEVDRMYLCMPDSDIVIIVFIKSSRFHLQISFNITKLRKDEKYTSVMINMKSYSCRL